MPKDLKFRNHQPGPGYGRFMNTLTPAGAEEMRLKVLREQEEAMNNAGEIRRKQESVLDAMDTRSKGKPVIEPDYPPPSTKKPRKRR